MSGAITIVGLGPGESEMMTRQAWRTLELANVVYLRTERHPAVRGLPSHLQRRSFDHIYESEHDFAAVYEKIASKILDQARDGAQVVYAVPGDPYVGESTVEAIVEGAHGENLGVTIVPGVSFVEPTLSLLGVDALDGLQLFDAIKVAGYNHPPVNPDHPLLLGQVYSRLLASELKLALMAIYPDEHNVVLVHTAGTARQRTETLPLFQIDHSEHIDHMTSLFVPPLPYPASLSALAEAVAVLRSPQGCPWDREQTPLSLRPGLLEEVSEVLEALDTGDAALLQEELGDLLLHIVMQVQMAREEELFGLGDVVGGIYGKLRRRHPHVWGDWEVEGSDEVVANWEAIKADEKGRGDGHSLLDDLPRTLPALARSQEIQERVRQVGFDWPRVEGVIAKLQEEIGELQEATARSRQADELGDVLFAVVNWARWMDLDAESALRQANLRFVRRFRRLEELARNRGIEMAEADIETLEELWQEAKASLAREDDA